MPASGCAISKVCAFILILFFLRYATILSAKLKIISIPLRMYHFRLHDIFRCGYIELLCNKSSSFGFRSSICSVLSAVPIPKSFIQLLSDGVPCCTVFLPAEHPAAKSDTTHKIPKISAYHCTIVL